MAVLRGSRSDESGGGSAPPGATSELRSIPGYVVGKPLEHDLVSATYLAERRSDGFPVMLQVISEEFSGPDQAEAFFRTLEDLARVRHPVIPTILDVGAVDGRVYCVSDAVEGRSLAATIAARGRLAHDDSVAVCTELADALDMVHSAGIVHGAVNPRTVWINDRERSPSAPWVSLRGFGSTPMLSGSVLTNREEAAPADVLYVAPEQIRGDEQTERIDQYALACMALHCLTGSPPFERTTINSLFGAHLFTAPGDLELRADELAPEIVAALRTALAKDPSARFSSCGAFATAIGGTAQRSWTWMIEESPAIDLRDPPVDDQAASPPSPGRARAEPPREIVLDDVAEAGDGPGARAARDADRGNDRAGRAAPPEPVLTARSLAQVDWFPGSATRTGPRPAVRRTAPRDRGVPRPPDRQRSRLAIGVVLVLVVAGGIATGLTLATPRDQNVDAAAPGADAGAGSAVREIEASWRQPIADGPVSALRSSDGALISAAGDTVGVVDPGTGDVRWRTRVGDPVQDLVTVADTVVVRTASGLHALDGAGGVERWTSSDTGTPAMAAVAAGRGRLFGVATGDGTVTAAAVDPATGGVAWSTVLPAAPARDDPTTSIAFDGSEEGGQTLYVAHGTQLHAVDTTTREARWRIDLGAARAQSIAAVAGAVLVVGSDGSVCRYDERAGSAVWTTCAALEREDASASVIAVRNRLVLVGSEHEVMAVDFTRGTPQWRIVADRGLQLPSASTATAAFVVAADGTVEAIAQRNGATLWESAPFGEITAMAASDAAVYVTTADGRLTRLEAPEAPTGDTEG